MSKRQCYQSRQQHWRGWLLGKSFYEIRLYESASPAYLSVLALEMMGASVVKA